MKNLDKQLQKEEGINETAKQSMQDEINRARQILGLTTQFEEAKAKIKKIYALKEINTFRKEYQTRIREHANTISKLEAQEKSLTNKIVELQRQLNARLKRIENERILAIGNIEDRIQNLQLAGASEYQKYIAIKERADKKYALAKEALEKGNMQLAKSYMSQYSSLISQISNKEIKENGRVILTKEQANKVAIANLKKLESLTNAYYTKEKQEAINTFNAKIKLVKAQLEATKEQLKLEVQRLNLEKQMIQIMTGKKVTIDTSGALNEIKNLDKEIKNLDKQIKNPKKIKVGADTNEAKNKIDNETKKLSDKKIKMKVDADTQEAKNKVIGVLEITDKATHKTNVIKIKADGTEVEREINKIKKPTESKHTIKLPNINSVKTDIESLNNLNTSSTHTIYIREVHTKATGGIIPLKKATGGEIEFKRQSGKIAGYDPYDSDDVPALLTRGEFVIKRDAVSHYGESFLYALNNKLLPKFATGGIVQRGNPEKITQDLSKNLDDVSNNDSSDIDLSKIDDLIEQLRKLADTFKLGGALDKSNEALQLVELLKNEKNKINKQAEKEKKDEKDYENYKNSVKGKVLTQEQEKEFENNLKSKKNIVDLDNKQLDKLNKEKQKIIENISDKIREFNFYLEEVKNVKNMINDKLNEIGINEDEFNGLNESLDLERLNNFYNRLINSNIPTKDDIKTAFDRFVMQVLYGKKQSEYIQTGYSLINNPDYQPPNYNTDAIRFLNQFGVTDSMLQFRIKNLLQYSNGKTPSFSDENAEILLKDILKIKLPKFQTGGYIALQNGGKLNGYGGGDRNLALLEDGEFVIRKEAVSHFGANLFEKLNNLKLPKFQTGGYIGNLNNSGNLKNDSIDLNFNIGNKSYTLNTQRNVAEELVRELKKLM